jgi:hypothetical protein
MTDNHLAFVICHLLFVFSIDNLLPDRRSHGLVRKVLSARELRVER